MRVLVACEFSGIVREAFRKRGHDAWSCDILDAEDGSKYHIKDDVLKHLNDGWDLSINHPPCTYLCNSGVVHIHRDPNRINSVRKGREFFLKLLNADIPKICVENPIPHKYAELPKYSQIIQPYNFGDPHMKTTCLWLKNLPKLYPTSNSYNWELLKPTPKVKPQMVRLKNGQLTSKFHTDTFYLPKNQRGHARSKTFEGIAKAMAEQWG